MANLYIEGSEVNMKIYKPLLLCIVLLFVITGCSFSDEQKIVITKLNKNQYEDFKEITDQKVVSSTYDTLKKADWRKAKMDMVRKADYQFQFQFTDPKIETKAATYSIWISPKEGTLELIKEDSEYVHLDKKESAVFFKHILTKNK